MDKLLARDRPLDAIVIETSGLALPQPLLKAFAWPSVRTRATVDGVVTVVDALALAEGRLVLDEEEHDHDDFDSMVVTAAAATAPEALRERVAKALGLDGVLRVKGHARIVG